MNKLSLTCDKCGGRLAMGSVNGYTVLSCPHCGSSFELLDEDPSVRRSFIAAETEKSRYALTYSMHRDAMDFDRNAVRIRVIAVIILAILLVGLIAYVGIRESSVVSLPFSARDLQNKPYSEAVCLFRDLGISDIRLIPLGDLRDTFWHNCAGDVGKVSRVAVSGNESFRKGARFGKDAIVRIWYRSYP